MVKIGGIQKGLEKIEYTLRYIDDKETYTDKNSVYQRHVMQRTLVVAPYTGDIHDPAKIESALTELFNHARIK